MSCAQDKHTHIYRWKARKICNSITAKYPSSPTVSFFLTFAVIHCLVLITMLNKLFHKLGEGGSPAHSSPDHCRLPSMNVFGLVELGRKQLVFLGNNFYSGPFDRVTCELSMLGHSRRSYSAFILVGDEEYLAVISYPSGRTESSFFLLSLWLLLSLSLSVSLSFFSISISIIIIIIRL